MKKLSLIIIGLLFFISCNNSEKGVEEEPDVYRNLLLSGIENTRLLKFDVAHNELNELIKRSESNSNLQYQILGYINLGNLYLQFNSPDEALRNFFKAQEISEDNVYDEYLNTIYNNIGIIYYTNDDQEQATNYFKKALALSVKTNNKNREAINLINLGNSELNNKNDAAALDYFSRSLEIFRSLNDSVNSTVALNNLGNLYFEKGEFGRALENYKQAVANSNNTMELPHLGEYYLNLGKTYYQFQLYDSATNYLNKSIEFLKKSHSTEKIIEAYNWHIKILLAENKLAEAFEYSMLSNSQKDSLLLEKTSKWVSEIQINYEFGKKEKEIEFIQQQAKRQNMFWVIMTIFAVVVAFLFYQILRTKNINLAQKNIILENEQQLNKLSLEKNEAQRKQLKEQIEVQTKINEIEQQKLRQELNFKNRELSTKALHLVNKNEVFSTLNKLFSDLDFDKKLSDKRIADIKQVIRTNVSVDKEWDDFKRHFEDVHPGFFIALKKYNDSLTPNDLRLCAYLLIKLNSKEIAQIFNISPESVRKRKQRLRQKLSIEKDEELDALLESYKENEHP